MTLKTSDLCDACDDAQVCNLRFTGYGQRRAFAGDIRTLRCVQGLAGLREAVNAPGHGQVLVIDGAGLPGRALFGDVVAGLAVRNGWAGVVVHGLIRDGSEIDAMDIGVKALGTVPRRADLKGASERDVPLTFGGATFTTGLRLVADDDGVIVLPPGMTEQSIRVADAISATAAYVTGTQARS